MLSMFRESTGINFTLIFDRPKVFIILLSIVFIFGFLNFRLAIVPSKMVSPSLEQTRLSAIQPVYDSQF